MSEEKNFSKALAYACRRLGARSQLSQEMRQALQKRQISPEIIEKVMTFCMEKGYLNDSLYIEQFIRYQISRRQSPKVIVQKLILKGADREVAQEAIEKLLPENSQLDTILQLLESRYQKRNLSLFEERQKVTAALYRKGFPLPLIQQAIRNCMGKN